MIYTVRSGDNPWNLTARYLAGIEYWPRIQKLNQISDPLHLAPGTRLRIPVAWLRRVAANAHVLAVQGQVEARSAGLSAPRTLAVGAELGAGDVIVTATDANVTLEFADHSRLLVHAETELHLDQLGRFDNTEAVDTGLSVAKGRVESQVKPLQDGPGRFEISTPSAVTAVRGTDYRVSAAADATRAEVLSGAVKVGNEAGTQQVTSGFGTVAASAQPPLTPLALLPAPDLSGLPARVERVPVAFTIPTIAGAVGYRVQIGTDPGFTALLFDGRSDSVHLRASDLPDGRYLLRVRGIDDHQLEGLDADHPFELHARPEPPLVTAPGPGAGVPEERPQMVWGQSASIEHYHVQLASDAGFTQLLQDDASIGGGSTTSPSVLTPGMYYWRIASIDAHAGQGPYSDTQSFRRLPLAPALEPPAINDKEVNVRWRAGEPGDSYQLQLASDEKFGKPLVDVHVDQAAAVFPRPPGGTYFMRVKTTYADGQDGVFGAPQRIDVPSGHSRRWLVLLLLPLVVLAL